MTSGRWAEIDRLYHAALERPPGERDAFVASACGHDDELRREVTSLLAHSDSRANDLDAGALAKAAALVSHPARSSMIGRRLRAYDVVALIGAGGMGEVYRARDSRLGRDVAIKILSPAFKADPDRTARFEREAQVLASLKHPHIGAIYGLEETEDITALVMELVEGEDLAARIARGPLPIADALLVARQIADALDAAHEQGIIHRDLKPANIRVERDGTVKVLDFGLAKPLSHESTSAPTLTAVSRHPGAIIGTPAYMSPEQARGESAGRESDVWAFGVVLYELLTAVSPFAKPTTAETLASVLGATPDYSRLPVSTPVIVRRLIIRCLERDPKRRWRHIGDVRNEIDDAIAGRTDDAAPTTTAAATPRLWQMVTAIALIAVAGLAGWFWPRTEPARELVRLTTMLPSGVSVTRGPGFASSVAVSPDGRTLVIAGSGRDGQRLYRRALDQLEATPLAGSERGSSPFFSPDGAWVGFFVDGQLKRIPVAGGAAVRIVEMPGFPAGASWGPNNRIVFAPGPFGTTYSVDAGGGKAERLPGVDSSSHPAFLPDGKTILFESRGWIHAHDFLSARTTRLVEGTTPRYAIGNVILSRGTTLLAAPFDAVRHELTGPVVPLLEGVARDRSAGGVAHFAVSANGTFAYVPAPDAYALVQVEADGTEHPIVDTMRSLENPRFSPDGHSIVVAAQRREGEPSDLWIHEPRTGAATRLTSNGGRAPLWTRDAGTITYSHVGEQQGIYTVAADGSGTAKPLVSLETFHWLVGWTPDRTLSYGLMEGTLSSINAWSDGKTQRVVGPSSIWGGRLSSDGRWLAYYSLDAGNFEISVTAFPGGGNRWPVADGTDPAWSPDGHEIYYRNGGRLMAARIDKSTGIRVLSQRVVVESFLPPLYDDYDIHPDGKTLVLVRPANRTQGREVTLVLNWHEELKRLVGSR